MRTYIKIDDVVNGRCRSSKKSSQDYQLPIDDKTLIGTKDEVEDIKVLLNLPGIVRVGTKSCRGTNKENIIKQGLNPHIPTFTNYDATSASTQKLEGKRIRDDFSPMLIGPIEGALIFENFWQYLKVYKELGHIDTKGNITKDFLNFKKKGFGLTKGKRHPPEIKTGEFLKDPKGNYIRDAQRKRRSKYLIPAFSYYKGNTYNYIDARKYIYAPGYASIVKNSKSFKELKKRVEKGENVQIMDFDGPPDGDIEVDNVEMKSHVVTKELLKNKINDPKSPFGHGYVLAGLLAGIEPKDYI